MVDFPVKTQDLTGRVRARLDQTGLMGVALFSALVLGGAGVFWYGMVALAEAWTAPEYSHGPLIPVLSFYLFLRQLKEVPPITGPIRDRWPGFIVTAIAVAIGMIGNAARIPDIVTYGMIVWFYGLLLISFGWRHGRQFWPPVLHLVFMLPLPAFLYWQLSIKLQFISSEIGVMIVRLMDIPVFLDGNIIDLGVYKLHVAEACSGLRYLFPVMSFSYIFAVLYQGPIWHKAVLLLSAAPITILMNSFRIGIIGVMVDNYGIEYAEGFLHLFEGWVIFIACVAILFGLARLMQWIARDRRPFHEALDLDYSGLGAQAARILNILPSAALAAATVLTVALALAWNVVPARETVAVSRAPLVLFPRALGEWQAGPLRQLDSDIKLVLKADDYISTQYLSPDQAAPVDFFVAYYDRQTEGSGIHSPEVCIPAGGWEMSRITQEDVALSGGGTMPVNRAVIQKGLSKQLVYYWFEQRGRRITSDYHAKAVTVLDAITLGRTDGALVRLITPIRSSEAEAEARLDAFLGEMLPRLPEFIPGREAAARPGG